MSSKINSVLNQHLGNITRWQKEATGISGETRDQKFSIKFYNDSIARISITRSAEFETFSYSVIAEPKPVNFGLEESGDQLVLKTSKFILQIKKNLLRFRFKTLQGEVINEDDEAFGTSW